MVGITVYNSNFEYIGYYETIVRKDVTKKFIPPNIFSLTVPCNKDTVELFKTGNWFCFDGLKTELWQIENAKIDNRGTSEKLILRGRDASSLFSNRIILGTVNYIDKKASHCINDILTKNVIQTDTSRRLPKINIETGSTIGDIISFQNSYGDILKQLNKICTTGNVGYKILWGMESKEFYVNVYAGTDRSSSVIFSPFRDNITSYNYSKDITNWKTTAIVAGEGEDNNRKIVTVGDNYTGYNRREMYVDARDLQSKIKNDDGTETTLTNAEYEKILTQRGKEKLAEQKVTITLDAKIKTDIYGSIYKTNWDIGDIVGVNLNYGISSNERITEIQEKFSYNKYEIIPKFGKNALNVINKIKEAL